MQSKIQGRSDSPRSHQLMTCTCGLAWPGRCLWPGWYWIDPTQGSIDDAIQVWCNMTNTIETCVYPTPKTKMVRTDYHAHNKAYTCFLNNDCFCLLMIYPTEGFAVQFWYKHHKEDILKLKSSFFQWCTDAQVLIQIHPQDRHKSKAHTLVYFHSMSVNFYACMRLHKNTWKMYVMNTKSTSLANIEYEQYRCVLTKCWQIPACSAR